MARVSTATVRAIAEVLRRARPQPIMGGPVRCSSAEASGLCLLPWWCDCQIQIALEWCHHGERTAILAVEGVDDAPHHCLAEMQRALEVVKPGDTVEVLSANTGSVKRDSHILNVDRKFAGGNQHYILRRMKEGWEITHAAPRLDGSNLRRALELIGQVRSTSPNWSWDPDEVSAALEVGRRSMIFSRHREREEVVAEGPRVTIQPEWRAHLGLLFFRLRFADGPWDVRPAWEYDEECRQAWCDGQLQLKKLAQEILDNSPPPLNESLLTTERGTYGRHDTFSIGNDAPSWLRPLLASRYPELGDKQMSLEEAVRQVDRDMEGVGLHVLGGVAGAPLGSTVVRAYSSPQSETYGWLSVNPDGVFDYAFYSNVEDGLWVITGTHEALPGTKQPAKVSRWTARVSAAELYAHHRRHLAQRCHGGQMCEAPQNLEQFAEAVDRYFAECGF